MKLIFVRHGDPDYEHDTLTERGWQEAALLAERMKAVPADAYFLSPLGRARDTASLSLRALGREAEICDWLQEFRGRAFKPHEPDEPTIAWDWLPKDWAEDDRFYRASEWTQPAGMAELNASEEYDRVCQKFDALLARYGYKRDGRIYRVTEANTKTLVFFCHFGVTCVMLSHLLSISPMTLWHGFCAAPTSLTTVYTEEREKGVAAFRIAGFGDVSHLLSAGLEPSFSARFCEVYDDFTQRH